MKRVVVVGGGFTGLSAAYDLARAGCAVTLLEADTHLGGLAGTFEVSPGVRLEKFYHHWFTSDRDVLQFIEELGIGDRILRLPSTTGLYFANSIFRLAKPLDLLRFPGIPFIDRVRTGLMALWARRVSDWRSLEDVSAEEWLVSIGGRRAYEVIWRPLLAGKFGDEAPHVSAVWIWNKLKLRGSSRGRGGREELVYLRGGFGAVTNEVAAALAKAGVTIRTGVAAERVLVEGGAVRGVRTAGGDLPADEVLVTTPLPLFLNLCPELPESYQATLRQIRFLGNVCVVLALDRSLSSTYWLNVADPSFPFVGVIEHTNLDDPQQYGGEHIAYLSKYLSTSDPRFSLSDEEYLAYALPYLNRIFPTFSQSWIRRSFVWRAHYSQPVITKGYSRLIPGYQTPIGGLWVASMAQVYPEDRGTNYAVREGRAVARRILATS